jgi:hypothetical protein
MGEECQFLHSACVCFSFVSFVNNNVFFHHLHSNRSTSSKDRPSGGGVGSLPTGGPYGIEPPDPWDPYEPCPPREVWELWCVWAECDGAWDP